MELSGLTDQALEGLLAHEEVSALLVATDLTKGHGTGPVPVGFLDASCGWGGLASCLCGKLLAWGFATGRLASGLLGTSHVSGVLLAQDSEIYLLYLLPCYLVGLASLGRPIATKGEVYVLQCGYIYLVWNTHKNDWKRKRRKGIQKGWYQASQAGAL